MLPNGPRAIPRACRAAVLLGALAAAAGLVHGQSTNRPDPGSAEWVARQVQDRDTGRDSKVDLEMRLFDRQNRVRQRTMSLLTLRGAGSSGDRLLIRFRYPNDIKGTGFLVLEHPNADDERFLFLPALGRVRRIAGEEKQESFVGSDFTYEDIGGRELDDYTYALLDANASWTGSGRTWPAWRLESRARDANASFPRVVSLVLKEVFLVVQGESFNRRNEPAKRFEVRRIEQIEGIWTAMDMVMSSERDRTRTELAVTAADYNVGLEASDFTQRELERGGR